jgi:hypothetical protein
MSRTTYPFEEPQADLVTVGVDQDLANRAGRRRRLV